MIRGFIYEWTDNVTGLKYIGKHEGDQNDGYIGSGTIFKKEYNLRPNNFSRKILWESKNSSVEELIQIETALLEQIPEDELYFGKNRKYYNIVKNSEGYTSENNPMKNPELVKQMLLTREEKGTHKNPWERTVEKYGYDVACELNRKNKLGNKYGCGNKGLPKSKEHKKKISEKIQELSKNPTSRIGKHGGRSPCLDYKKTIEIYQKYGFKQGAEILNISVEAFKGRYYTAKNKLKPT